MSLNIVDIETPEQYLVPRDGLDRPMIVPETGGRPVPYTRTTTFIDCIEDKSSLTDHGKRAVLVGAARSSTLLDEVRALDPYKNRAFNREDIDFRDRLNEIAERAYIAAGGNEKADQGTHLHALSEVVDAGQPLPDTATPADRLDMAAYKMAVMERGFTFSHIEEFVVIPELKVGGTPDRICTYSGPGPLGRPIRGHFIFDLKTGTVEYGGLKMASQLAAYSRARFYKPSVFPAPPYAPQVRKSDPRWDAYKRWQAWKNTEFDAELAATAYSPIPRVNKSWGIILNLPSGTSEVELYWADLRIGWKAAKLAKTIRATRALSSKALVKFADV